DCYGNAEQRPQQRIDRIGALALSAQIAQRRLRGGYAWRGKQKTKGGSQRYQCPRGRSRIRGETALNPSPRYSRGVDGSQERQQRSILVRPLWLLSVFERLRLLPRGRRLRVLRRHLLDLWKSCRDRSSPLWVRSFAEVADVSDQIPDGLARQHRPPSGH